MNTQYPKISIITCVYNGEKYIARLFESVLNMGYPNIEHIVINDGSNDSTEDIVLKYSTLYRDKTDANMYIKYIKQKNKGLGSATNIGLRSITGEYWTWINCDDWYEKNAFNIALKSINRNNKYDFIQLNGYIIYGDDISKKETIVTKKSRMHFNNKTKLYIDYCFGEHFKYLLYLCKTSSYRKICPTMQIEHSKYTQDEQLIAQIFGVLNGTFCRYPCWNFYRRTDSYYEQIKSPLKEEHRSIFEKSMYLTILDKDVIKSRMLVFEEEKLLMEYKKYCLKHDRHKSLVLFKNIKELRKSIGRQYRSHLDKKLLLYLIYCYI